MQLKKMSDCPSWRGVIYQHEKASVCDRCWKKLERQFDYADEVAAQEAEWLMDQEREEQGESSAQGGHKA